MSLIEEMMKREPQGSELRFELASGAEVPMGDPPTDDRRAVAWMNVKHFVASENGKIVVITEETDPVLERRVLERSSFQDLRNRYCNRWVDVIDTEGNPKRVQLGKHWLGASNRRQFDGIVCAPQGCKANYYNLWQGFSVTPAKGDWSLMERHIKENICGKDEDVYWYVRRWLAFAVQHPGDLPEVALVMRGKEGTGKGVFARGFGALFGQHFLHLTQKRHLIGNFNSHLRDAIVVFADEAFLADDDKNAEGVLKAMITEPEHQVEAKFKDVVTCKNNVHLLLASNNDRVIKAGPEARRFCFLDVSDAHLQDSEYFEAINGQLRNGGLGAMLYDLQREDLSGFDPRQFPNTAGLEDQKVQSMDPAERWWFKKLEQGRLSDGDYGWTTEVLRENLLADYRVWARRQHDHSQDLGNFLRRVLPKDYPVNGPRVSVGDKRMRTWVLPSLDQCRRHFEDLFKFEDCWPDEGDVQHVQPVS
jgi:hypothetical protein